MNTQNIIALIWASNLLQIYRALLLGHCPLCEEEELVPIKWMCTCSPVYVLSFSKLSALPSPKPSFSIYFSFYLLSVRTLLFNWLSSFSFFSLSPAGLHGGGHNFRWAKVWFFLRFPMLFFLLQLHNTNFLSFSTPFPVPVRPTTWEYFSGEFLCLLRRPTVGKGKKIFSLDFYKLGLPFQLHLFIPLYSWFSSFSGGLRLFSGVLGGGRRQWYLLLHLEN